MTEEFTFVTPQFTVGCKNTERFFYQIWKKKNKQSFYSWKMDETSYQKLKGKWHYLYRAIDVDGLTLDIWLRKKARHTGCVCFSKTTEEPVWRTKGSSNG